MGAEVVVVADVVVVVDDADITMRSVGGLI